MAAPPQRNPARATPSPPATRCLIVLTGNPNCGKTTLFNALTGLRARVGNYAGVTVERKEGRLLGTHGPQAVTVLDLPGTYSLSPQSLDEQIARDVLLGHLADVPTPDAVVVVVDASNLERNLYFATQVVELGYPTLIALNMVDVAKGHGHLVDAAQLERELGVPVFPMVASTREGVPALRSRLLRLSHGERLPPSKQNFCPLPALMDREVSALASVIGDPRTTPALPSPVPPQTAATRAEPARDAASAPSARAQALLLLSDPRPSAEALHHHAPTIQEPVQQARSRIEAAGIDWRTAAIEARYSRAAAIHDAAVTEAGVPGETVSDRLDRVFTHRTWGTLIFLALMALMFQSIFTFAQVPMGLLEGGVGWLGRQVAAWLPAGDLRSLLVDGVVAGVGAVVVFLPQICLLFLFIGLLEDTGYMARAAFLMDRLMSKVGLHGKSFIPMLSSFACAIPGIMATRTIESPKDRLVTLLIAPLMSCSARLPVYTLLIAACIPERQVLGLFRLSGLTLLGMYLLGTGLALGMAWVFKKTLLRGHVPMLIMELPPYKRPTASVLLRHVWERSRLFLHRAGTVILGVNILLWFLASYPRDAALEGRFAQKRAALEARQGAQQSLPDLGAPQRTELEAAATAALDRLDTELAGERLRHSFAGRLGRLIEPAIRPLGFDWKIGIGIVTSFAAREIFVSTMSVVYNVGGGDDPDAVVPTLAETLRQQTRPDGTPLYTTLTGLTLMVFYVAALQCVSTVAIVRRETNSWKWPCFQWAYMAVLAWVLAFLTWQGGRLLGFQ